MIKPQNTPFGDIAVLQRGFDLPSNTRNAGCYPVISSSGISGTHSDYKVGGVNVVTGRYGTIGKVFYYDGPCWPLNTTLYIKDYKGNNPRYIAYLLEATLAALRIDGGDKSAVPGIDRNVIHALRVPFFSHLSTQNAITSLLVLLDNTIECNQRLISELESTAKLIYDYWFTQFDFPDENGKPYRSSGGKMVYSPELKREIPEGWYVALLSDICSYSADRIATSELTESSYVTTDSLLQEKGGIKDAGSVPIGQSVTRFRDGDTLISNIRPY